MHNSSYVKNCFFIKNKKKFFSYEKVITVKEAIELCKDKKLSIYNFDFCGDENFDENSYTDDNESFEELDKNIRLQDQR